ncbi:MAG: DUF4296 domain-containing protein [Bacteroidales bacterium]|nr:DUF4296 domain-containing protein [Bacteroidales bacterium]
MRKLVTIIPFLLLFSCLSCNKKDKAPNREVLSENRMVEFLVDLHLLDGTLQSEANVLPEKRMDKALYLYPSLMDKYGITRAQADSSINWYSNHPKKLERIYQRVVNELLKKEASQAEADTTNSL